VALKPLASTRYALTEIDILASLQWLMLFYMQAPPMEGSQTPNAALASDPVSQVHTPESLMLHDFFQSRSLLLQYLSGMLDADGSVTIHSKGGARLEAIGRFYQSNLCFLTAINAEFGYTGNISTHSAAGTVANVNEGRCSEGEMRQVLTFVGKAADKVAAELAQFSVTKTQHFKVLLEMLNQPNGLLTKSEYRDRIRTLNSHPEDSILA